MEEKLKPAEEITAEDVANFLGTEKEYKDALFEEELKKNYETIMSDDFEKNNIISEDMDT